MNPEEALNHFEQALSANARPAELQDEARVVGAMVEAIAANPSPPATVPSLDVARRARARGRRRVASVVAIAALCTTSVAAATGSISTPDLIDWSNFLPGRSAEEPPPDDSTPKFELGDVEVPVEADRVDETDGGNEAPEGPSDPSDSPEDADSNESPKSDERDDRKAGPSEEKKAEAEDRKGGPSEDKKDEAEDRKAGPSEEKKAEAEDRKGGPSEEKDKRGEGWKNLEAEKNDKSNSASKSDSKRDNAEKTVKEKRSDNDVEPEKGKQGKRAKRKGAGEPSEGHEGNTPPGTAKSQQEDTHSNG